MIMGIELFGATRAVYLAVACFLAYLCSGHSSIYLAQRLGVPKRRAIGTIPSGVSFAISGIGREPAIDGVEK